MCSDKAEGQERGRNENYDGRQRNFTKVRAGKEEGEITKWRKQDKQKSTERRGKNKCGRDVKQRRAQVRTDKLKS